MNPDLQEIKGTLRELTDTLQAYIMSEKNDDGEKKLLVQSVATSLDKLAKATPQMQQVNSAAEFVTNFLAAIKGEPGKEGATPVKGKDYFTPEDIDEIALRVKSLIPDPENGETPEKGVDYLTPDEVEALIREVLSRIPAPKPAKDGEPGKDAVVDYDAIVAKILPLIPKPKDIEQFTPDTPKDIVKKLRSLKDGERLSIDDLKDVPDFAAIINRAKQQSVKDPGIAIEGSGTEIAALISRINFTGSGVTVTKVGDRVVVQISGGGGAANVPVQESLAAQVVDGVNVTYTLTSAPVANSLQLFINEALVSPSRYSLVGSTITFGTPLDSSLSGLPFDAFYEKTP